MGKNDPQVTPQQAAGAFNELMLSGQSSSGLSFEQAFDLLDKAPEAAFETLNADYLKFDKEGKYSFIFTGMSTATLDSKTVDVALLSDREGKQYIAAQTTLVSACKKVTTMPCFIRIEYTGKKGTGNNIYQNLIVSAVK